MIDTVFAFDDLPAASVMLTEAGIQSGLL